MQSVVSCVKKELMRMQKAFGYSLYGLQAVWKSEAAFRVEVVLAGILTPVALLVQNVMVYKLLMVSSLLLVLLAELANTAIETVINRIGTEPHPLSGKAKDIGSAMVFIALVNAGLTWLVLL